MTLAARALATRIACVVAAFGVNVAFAVVVAHLIASRIDGPDATRPVRVERFVPAPRPQTPERRARDPRPPAQAEPPAERRTDPVALARDRARALPAPVAGFDFSSIDLPAIGRGTAIVPSALPAAPPGASGDAAPGGASVGVGDAGGALAAPGRPELTPAVRVRPTYPMRALQMRVEGWVVVEYTIGRDGTTSDIAIIDAQPPGFFESAVEAAVGKWQFRPGDLAGASVSYRQQSRINFRLARP